MVQNPFRTIKEQVDPGIEATIGAGGGSSSRMQRLGSKALVGAEMLLPFKGVRGAIGQGAKSVGRGATTAAAKVAESRMFTPKPKVTPPPAFTGTGSMPAGSVVSPPPGGGSISVPRNPLEAPISGTGLKPTFQVGQTPPTPSFSARQPSAWPATVTNMQVPGAGTTMPAKVPPAFQKTTIPQMVEKHGVAAAAERAGLTPDEIWSGVLSDVEPVLPRGKVQITPKVSTTAPPAPPPKAPPKAKAPKTEAPPKAAAPKPKNEFENYPTETLESLAARGNKKAAEVLATRPQKTPAPPKSTTPKTSKSSAAEQKPVSEKPVTAAEIKKAETPPPRQASKQRPYAQMGEQKLSDKAAKGDANAIKELDIRRAEFEARFQENLKKAAGERTDITKPKPGGKGGSKALAVGAPAAALAVPDDPESNWDEWARIGLMGAGAGGVASALGGPSAFRRMLAQGRLNKAMKGGPDAEDFGKVMENDPNYQKWLNEQEATGGRTMPHDIQPDIQMTQEAGPGGGFSPRFRKMLSDETGQAPAGLFAPSTMQAAGNRVWDEVNALRVTAMLAGRAPMKSVLGNLGATGIASAERGTIAPIRELFKPETAKDWWQAFKSNQNPSAVPGQRDTFVGKYLGLPQRVMGAGDTATENALVRSGMTRAEAKEILLTEENPMAEAIGLNTKAGQYLVPFRKTPANLFRQGLVRPGRNWKTRGLALGAGGAGMAAGANVDDPASLGVLSAIAGPYALPFLLGAGVTGGARAVQGLSPVPEWSLQELVSSDPNMLKEQFVPSFMKGSNLPENLSPRERSQRRREQKAKRRGQRK
jgi:hypothetical protein